MKERDDEGVSGMNQLEIRLLERQAEICRALGNAKRLQIIHLLKGGPRAAGELAEALETTPANVSQHLAAMKQAGLVDNRREGSHVLYWLTTPAVLEACEMIGSVLADQLKREHAFIEETLD